MSKSLVALAEKKTFPSSKSGLVRGIGPVTAAMVAIAITVGWGWQIRVFQYTGYTPLPENLWFAGIAPPVMSYIIGGIIILIIMLGYAVLTSAMPRSGGGYVGISRILGPFAGFISAWFELYAIAIYIGYLAVLVFELSLYNIGPALGIIPVPASYNDVGFFAGGILLVALFTAVVALGVRVTGYVLQALVWIPAALGVYVLYLLGVAIVNPAILENGISLWGQMHGIAGVTADAYVQAALAQGLDAASVGNYWTAVSASLLGAYFAYVGYASTTFVAGEVKDPTRNLPRVLLIAPFIVIVMFVAMASFGAYAATAVGQVTLPNGNKWSFFEAYSYLSFGGGNLQQAKLPDFHATIPTLASMVGLGLGLGSLNIFVFLFSILWVVNDLPAFILVASRIIFAMSFDRVLPVSLTKVNGRFNSPVYATVLVGIFAVLGVLAETCIVCNGGSWFLGGTGGSIVNTIFVDGVFSTDLLDAVFFSLFSLAVLLFPFRLKRIYDTSSFKPGGRPGVVAIGLSGLIANFIITWVILTSPRGDVYNILSPTSDNLFALGFTGLLGLIGCLIYAYCRYRPQAKETDFSAIFSEIPPE